MATLPPFPGRAALPLFTALAALGCGSPSAPPSSGAAQTPPSAEVESPPAAYSYPAPVSGHFEEINTGSFDLVDGLAYPASGGAGTVVWAASEPIASPLVAGSACPMTEARALAVLRDASYVEVTIDARAHSDYFAWGTVFAGQSRESDVGGGYWRIDSGGPRDGRIAGKARHKQHGGFEFDLPIGHPSVTQVSEGERMQGRRTAADLPTPSEAKLLATYEAIRKAARTRNLKALLEAQGFAAETVRAVRGLAGIESDFAAFADRFFDPGTPEEPSVDAGYGGVGARGTNAKGEAFFNWYEMAPCGDRLVLTSIGLNPQ